MGHSLEHVGYLSLHLRIGSLQSLRFRFHLRPYHLGYHRRRPQGPRHGRHQEHCRPLLKDRLPYRGLRASSIINGMKNCMALAAVTDITFKEAETMKAYLADPSAFAVAAPVAAEAPKAEEKAAVVEESEDESMDGGMFDMFG